MTLPSDDTIQEQAYLISRGVRPLTLLGSVGTDPKEMEGTFIRLGQFGAYCLDRDNAVPFVLPRTDMDCAMVGFASHPWVVELLRWTYANAPLQQEHQIIGLLLGYAPEAIGEHDAMEFAGRPTDLSTSKLQNDSSVGTA